MKVILKNIKTKETKTITKAEHISLIQIDSLGFFDIDFKHYNINIWEIQFIHSEN